MCYGDNRQYDLAIADYTKAIQLNNNNGYVFTLRGGAYSQQGLYDLAIKDYDRAIELNPNDIMPRVYKKRLLDKLESNN